MRYICACMALLLASSSCVNGHISSSPPPPPSAAAPRPLPKSCVHGKPSSSSSAWLHNETLKARVGARTPVVPQNFTVDLSLPASERWSAVTSAYKDKAYMLIDYLRQFIPASVFPIVESLAAKLIGYKGFERYGDEMRAMASGLNVSLGDIVAVNLVYQLEHIGINCSNWNNVRRFKRSKPLPATAISWDVHTGAIPSIACLLVQVLLFFFRSIAAACLCVTKTCISLCRYGEEGNSGNLN